MAVARVAMPRVSPVLTADPFGRQSLNNAVSGQHTTVLGEVPAHHEGPHRGVLLRKVVRLVREVGPVLPAVHKNQTGPAVVRVADAVVRGVIPSTAPAKACK